MNKYLSGKLYAEEYVGFTVFILAAAVLAFYCKAYIIGGKFLWQALLGISIGLFVGFNAGHKRLPPLNLNEKYTSAPASG